MGEISRVHSPPVKIETIFSGNVSFFVNKVIFDSSKYFFIEAKNL